LVLSWFGYGYADQRKQNQFSTVYNRLFWNKRTISLCFCLIDIRHEAQTIEDSYMGRGEIPFALFLPKQTRSVK
jgi:GTP-binding protein